jgi:phage terminase large subunit-like protein
MTVDPDQYKRWAPAAQERALAALQQLTDRPWKPFYCSKIMCDGKPHGQWDFPHGRWDQHPPAGDWLTWLVRGGRGSGKTRTGAEWTHRRTKVSPRIALIAPTTRAARDTLVEGESGILACSPPGQMPDWEPSKNKLTFANGAVAYTFSGEEPDRLRGPQHYDAWLDEPAHIALIESVWSMLLFGMRLGKSPRICCTTTPVPTKWMKDLIADPSTVSVAVSTYANIDNLAPHFAQQILHRYEGTRLGRQEIHGEILADVEGALWQYEYFDGEDLRVEEPPADLDRIVVGVDPAGTNRKKSDETGIVVVGIKDGEFYVIADWSGKYSPKGWAERAMTAYREFSADAIVVETNYGGDMVRSTLENVDVFPRIEEVVSRRGKVIRADPIVAIYEKGRVHHVKRGLGELEDQLVSWVPGHDSPDRLDALVHAMHNLARTFEPSTIAEPGELRNVMMLAGQRALASRNIPNLQIVRNVG